MNNKETIMRGLFKIVLIPAMLLVCASAGLWHVQGQREDKANQSIEAAQTSARQIGQVTVQVREGSFALKNLVLTKWMSSVILKGNLFNQTNHYLEQATFEIKAYDRDGKLLKGTEEKTIFIAPQLKAHASAPINSGYGVWLQGIPLEAVARIELSETGDESAASSLIGIIPFASHALAWKQYSEIEE